MASPAANPFDDPPGDSGEASGSGSLEEMVRALLNRSTRVEQVLASLEARIAQVENREATSRPIPRSPRRGFRSRSREPAFRGPTAGAAAGTTAGTTAGATTTGTNATGATTGAGDTAGTGTAGATTRNRPTHDDYDHRDNQEKYKWAFRDKLVMNGIDQVTDQAAFGP